MRPLLLALAVVASAGCSTPPATPPEGPRLYIFDTGEIAGLDPKLFNFTREELKEVDFVNRAYLIVHPRGTVMFESGGIGDERFPADGSPAKDGVQTAARKLVPQMEAAGYKPADITYLVLSHYHADHTGNANLFAGAIWIVQKAEHDGGREDDAGAHPGPPGAVRETAEDRAGGAGRRPLSLS